MTTRSVFGVLNERDQAHPGLGVYPLKAMQYAAVAEHFQPKLFLNSPFTFAAGINGGWEQGRNPGMWLLRRNYHFFRDANPALLDQFERACARSNLQLVQLNCVSRETLRDARRHPERHQDLVVRVCGFSAKFVALPPEWQDEFISRNFYGGDA